MHDDVSRLLGIEGMAVTGVVDHGWWIELEVEMLARAGCCRWCGRGSLVVKERDVVRIRDLPVVGRMTILLWRKRRYRCEACRRTFTETHPQLPSRQRVSGRFRGRLFDRCRDGAAHAEVARDEHTTRYQVQRAYQQGGDQLLRWREARPPRRLSLDEAHHRRNQELSTIISDLDRRRVVEVLDGRSRRVVERYLRSLTDAERQAIEVVSIDPYDAYRQAIHHVLPEARIVVDHFHLVRGVNTALDSIRRERQRQHATRRPKGTRRSGYRDRWNPELYRARHRLLKASERLSERDRRSLCALFEREPLLAEAWGLKEAFRSIYKARDRADTERRLQRFYLAVEHAHLRPFTAFAKGLTEWQTEMLAYFDEPTTNGYAEGVINKIKVIKRRAYGLPTFTGFRKRVVIACG
jgi:transposase